MRFSGVWMDQLQAADWSRAGWVALFSYLLGCIATGYYLVRMRMGMDIRENSSGSTGARNVGRVLGWPGFVGTLAGDFGKGALAVWAVQAFTKSMAMASIALVCVVIGHIWPVQLRFRGGKGVAASLGALLVFDLRLAVSFVFLFLVAFPFVRRTVLPGLFAFAWLPVIAFYFGHEAGSVLAVSLLAGLVLVTHRRNIIEESAAFIERRNIHSK